MGLHMPQNAAKRDVPHPSWRETESKQLCKHWLCDKKAKRRLAYPICAKRRRKVDRGGVPSVTGVWSWTSEDRVGSSFSISMSCWGAICDREQDLEESQGGTKFTCHSCHEVGTPAYMRICDPSSLESDCCEQVAQCAKFRIKRSLDHRGKLEVI